MNVLLIHQLRRPDQPFSDIHSLQPPQWEAAALSTAQGVDLWVAPWYHLAFDDNGVVLAGTAYRSQPNGVLVEAAGPERFGAVLCFPVADDVVIDETSEAVERAALARLKLPDRSARLEVVLSCLRHARAAGQITNLESGELELDNKVTFALYMNDLEAVADAPRLPRPHTVPCLRTELSAVVASLPSPAEYLIKPAGGTRGLRILRASEFSAHDVQSENYWIVQQLVADPWIIEERKADARVYVVVDTHDRQRSRVTDACMVRLGAVPYQRGLLDAEITSNATRQRLGLPPAIYPLHELPLSDEERAAARRAVETVGQRFLDVYYWWARDRNEVVGLTRRVLIWGVDVFLQQSADGLVGWFVEANFYPFLFQWPANCRPTIWKMLAERFGPALTADVACGTAL